MVINELLKLGSDLLKDNSSNPSLEARLILSKLLDVDKSFVYAYPDMEINERIAKDYNRLCFKRKEGYPLQYILGKQEFYGREFLVKEGVLIPRGDTEVLVEKALDKLKLLSSPLVLDIGAGSGVIGISIALEKPSSNVYGVDINPKAIELSIENATRLKAKNISFEIGDLFEPFKDKRFDMVISNPPYIPFEDKELLQTEVKAYEPESALFAKEGGLFLYKKISAKAKTQLKEGGLICFEIGFNQGQQVTDILKGFGYLDIELFKDLEHRDRVVIGRKA